MKNPSDAGPTSAPARPPKDATSAARHAFYILVLQGSRTGPKRCCRAALARPEPQPFDLRRISRSKSTHDDRPIAAGQVSEPKRPSARVETRFGLESRGRTVFETRIPWSRFPSDSGSRSGSGLHRHRQIFIAPFDVCDECARKR